MDTHITGSTIKTLREAKGLTQAELADKIGVTSKAVSKWETAKGLPNITLIQLLAAALDTSIVELMGGKQIIKYDAHKVLCLSCLRKCNSFYRRHTDFVLWNHIASP